MRAAFLLILFCLGAGQIAPATDANYKQVTITSGTNYVRVRLPLTDVTGKVRVKEITAAGFGIPVAPSKTALGEKNYLEWQIGYDTSNPESPSVVPQIKFTRKGETKYGHELAKIVFECVRLGLLTTNDLIHELASLKQITAADFEEGCPVQIEATTNAGNGFHSSVERLPQFTKTTPHGSVQIQLKQKQRAVGYQAMVYVCIPMTEILSQDGTPRQSAKAKSKETIFYDFNRANTPFLLDIVHAFGIASQQHNEDIQKILAGILESPR